MALPVLYFQPLRGRGRKASHAGIIACQTQKADLLALKVGLVFSIGLDQP